MIKVSRRAYQLLGEMTKAMSGKHGPGWKGFQFRVPKNAFIYMTLLALIIPAVHASTDTYQLICENPRREYTVRFSDGDTSIHVGAPEGTTLYRVLAVEQTAERHVVVALTINDGPTVRLSLRPYLRMEYWSRSELVQTDACRTP